MTMRKIETIAFYLTVTDGFRETSSCQEHEDHLSYLAILSTTTIMSIQTVNKHWKWNEGLM